MIKTFVPFRICAVCEQCEATPRQHQVIMGGAVVTVDLGGEIPLENPDIEICIDCQRKALEKALEALNEVA